MTGGCAVGTADLGPPASPYPVTSLRLACVRTVGEWTARFSLHWLVLLLHARTVSLKLAFQAITRLIHTAVVETPNAGM